MSGHDHHEHEHQHDEPTEHVHSKDCGCTPESQEAPDAIHVECHLHDEARVISASLTLAANYSKLKPILSEQLEILAKAVHACGGIVGHIKASVETKQLELFSVTDADVSVKTAAGQEIKINLAAIVFLIEPAEAESLVTDALNAVRDKAGL